MILDLAELSKASELCGIPTDILKMMAADDSPKSCDAKPATSTLQRNDIPTLSECVSLLKEQRDRRLRRPASALRRLETELEAVRNDITEAASTRSRPSAST